VVGFFDEDDQLERLPLGRLQPDTVQPQAQ
jgi:hypothetical protein